MATRVIDALYQKMRSLEAEIDTLRLACSHPEYDIRLYSWRPGAFYPTKMCVVCDATLGEIDNEEDHRIAAELIYETSRDEE